MIDYTLIAKILGPKGVRATATERSMKQMDNVLATIATVTRWPRVALDRHYAVSIGNRSFLRVCAEREQLRAQYALQIAIARCKREPVVVLDRVDHLDTDNQPTLFSLLHALCRRPDPPAFLVCGTDLDFRHLNPDGRNHRIDDGVLKAD